MIIDNIKNASLYYCLGERFEKGLKFLESFIPDSSQVSRREIDGENVYAMVSEYTQKPASECRWEAHEKYADIQFVAKGTELIGYAFKDRAKSLGDYDAAHDVEFFDTDGTMLRLDEGDFVIFFSEDVHRPAIAPHEGARASKVVVKVKLD